MEMKAIAIAGFPGTFRAESIKREENGCKGCVGETDAKLCLSLPACGEPPIIFRLNVDPGPMTTAHPPEDAVLYSSDPDHGDPAVKLPTSILLEPSPVGTSPSKLAAPSHGGYPDSSIDTSEREARGFEGMRSFKPFSAPAAMARVTDPQTSKDAATVTSGGKLFDLVITHLQQEEAGLTGKELAERTGRPLNSITPRFAQLRRAGIIHDSAIRRDKQVVWKMGNGVQL